ncbi:SLC13 family permease [Shewanella abyssi]|uniref:SLC13 family permease n=1 Tax=Shewanella abyssi TaxID=311789 RepID=UPI0020101E9C|nr:SLC13 family permease [Shewanella abyssi]MCL1049571.1 SLC13 family permease [Shewanella abyssi]
MSANTYLTLLVFFFTLAGLIKFQTKTAQVFGATLISLVLFNLVNEQQLLSSLANPGLLTLLLLMVCSFALEKTRLLRIIASKVIVKSYNATWLRLFGVTALSSAMLNNTAVVATLLSPIRNNPYHLASKLLLPLSYTAILGGTLTLIGTSTNLIVNSLYIQKNGESLAFFSFTAIGALLVVGCGSVLFIACRWLPEIKPVQDKLKGYFLDAKVVVGSELMGKTVEQNGLRHLESLFLVEIVRDGYLISPVSPSEVIQLNDRLIFSGDINKVMQLSQFSGLESFADKNGLLGTNLTEAVVRSESVLVGKSLKTAGFRALFDAAVVAIRRDGESVSGKLGDVTIKAGDFLVLAVGKDYKNRSNINKNFIVLSGVEPDNMLKGWRAWLAVGGFVGTIGLAATNVIPMLQGLLVLLGVFLFTKILSASEIRRRFPVTIWLIVASAILLSYAMTNSGIVEQIEALASSAISANDAFIALVFVYLVTWLFTELVTNNAAAALMFPVAYSIALGLGLDPMPFVMTVAFAASGSFISPYGYQTNLMVFNAGQYSLAHFVKMGIPVSIAYALIVLTAVPIFFPF